MQCTQGTLESSFKKSGKCAQNEFWCSKHYSKYEISHASYNIPLLFACCSVIALSPFPFFLANTNLLQKTNFRTFNLKYRG